jgi:EAL domain-containing protein (putative c-di-GMP-specific phosphodiesterase class I)
VPLAEDSGLIVPIGKWVLNEACRQAAAWHRSGAAGLVVAVNLSAVQFRRADLFETVAAALHDSGLPAECLELELTESILIADTDNVLASVRSLKQLGVRFSIDDFGTGYSSLAYLKRFDVDKLKIDQSFVRELPGDANSAVIVEAIVRMASSLGLKTIAEGVEDEASLAFLRAQGCDEVQGYHFGRPQPADEFQARFIAGGRAPAAASTAPQDVLLVTAPYASSQ